MKGFLGEGGGEAKYWGRFFSVGALFGGGLRRINVHQRL